MRLTLRELRSIINEAKATDDAAHSRGYGLFVAEHLFVLYQLPSIDDFLKNPKVSLMLAFVGAVRLSGPNDIAEGTVRFVKSSMSSMSGFGPLIYDAALSMGNYVAPDRDQVSASASNVWKHYATLRDDVESVELPTFTHAHKDSPWLDRAYRIVDGNVRAWKITKAHDEFAAVARAELNMNERQLMLMFHEASRVQMP